jgi:hypothetical protein
VVRVPGYRPRDSDHRTTEAVPFSGQIAYATFFGIHVLTIEYIEYPLEEFPKRNIILPINI